MSNEHTSQQIMFNFKLKDGLRFESFYSEEESKNTETVTILKESLNSDQFQQNIIWGESFSGKTHLLQASCAKDASLNKTVTYLPLRLFKDSGIGVLSGLTLSHLIAIDDIDLVIGDKEWETALFNLINTARDNQQHLLLSSTQNPRMLDCSLPDLASRLIWGGSYQLNGLSDEETLKAIQARAEQRGFSLSDSVIGYLHRRYPRDIDSLMGILDKLDEESLLQKKVITVQFVKQVLE